MGLVRPAWTIVFGFICILVLPGAILTHYSVGKLIPAIKDLPDNIVKGFDEVFKFQYLKQDSTIVAKNAAAVLKKCGVGNVSAYCPTVGNQNLAALPAISVSTKTEKTNIQRAFGHSLDTVKKIANDRFLGRPDLQSTANNLNKITNDVNKIQNPMQCRPAVPVFCGIWTGSGEINKGMADVNKAIDAFKSGDIITYWEDNQGFLIFLHVLPYFMVFALAFFAFFIWKNGVCCCCREGTFGGTLALIPFVVFWLVSFIIYLIVLIAGFVFKYAADKVNVPVLKGKPDLETAIEHLKTNFKEFWDIVFLPLEEGLDILFTASFFFVAVALLIGFYASCECCCCPWRKPKEGAAETVSVVVGSK